MAEDFMTMYKQAVEGLTGGGKMLESQLADIEAGKQQAIAGGQQALVSSGLAGTTMMAGVPLQAERGAGRARLAARGQTERLGFQTLASYAALAQQAREARLEREAAMERLQMSITGQQEATAIGAQPGILATMKQGGMYPFRDSGGGGGGGGISSGGGGGGAGAGQFPSIYDTGGAGVPDWTGGGATATAHVGPSHAQATPGYGLADTDIQNQLSALLAKIGDAPIKSPEKLALMEQYSKLAATRSWDVGMTGGGQMGPGYGTSEQAKQATWQQFQGII